MQRMPNQNCNQYRKTSLSLIWRPGCQDCKGFWVWRTYIPRFCETSRCTSVLAPRETLISSCIWPPGSSPHEVQAVRLVDRNDTLRRSQWSVLEDVGPIWLGCSRVSGRTNQMFRSEPAVIDLLLKFRIWHHVMSCCVVILSLLVNKKLRQQWCLGTFMKHLKISRHPLLLELLVDSADQQMDS